TPPLPGHGLELFLDRDTTVALLSGSPFDNPDNWLSSFVPAPLGQASPTTLSLYAPLFEQAHHAAEARATLEAIRGLGTARRPRTSFSEGNPRDRVAVLEAPVIGIEPARPGEGD